MTNLNKLVTSLELSKRLKELGVKQDSLFYWQVKHPSETGKIVTQPHTGLNNDDYNWYSAYTAGELGEMLPHTVEVDNIRYFLEFGKGATYFNVRYGAAHDMGDPWDEEATTESDARALMLIYLLTSNLIK